MHNVWVICVSLSVLAAACGKGDDKAEDESAAAPTLVELDVSEAAAEAFPAFDQPISVLAPEGATASSDAPLTVSVSAEGFALELVTGVPGIEEMKAKLDGDALVVDEETAILYESDLGGYAVFVATGTNIVCRTPLLGDEVSKAQAHTVLKACKGLKIE